MNNSTRWIFGAVATLLLVLTNGAFATLGFLGLEHPSGRALAGESSSVSLLNGAAFVDECVRNVAAHNGGRLPELFSGISRDELSRRMGVATTTASISASSSAR